MTEEVQEVVQEVVSNPTEDKARDMGWMPKEDWVAAGKEEGSWRSAELFVELEPIFANQASLKKELRNAKKTLDEFKVHYGKVRETEYKRALDDLKAQKVMALQDGDAEMVVELDDQIARKVVEEASAKTEAARQMQEQAQQIHPEFAQWVNRNKWYTTDTEMQAFADSIGQAYARTTPGVEPQEVLKYVEKKVKQAFPDSFRNVNRDKAPVVETTRSPSRGTSGDVELSEEETRAMRKFVKSGLMTEQKYKEDIKKSREGK